MLKEYSKIERPILWAIAAEFFLQLINTTFFAILPLYMKKEGFSDGEIGDSIKYRYLGVLALAIFIGIYIRRRKLKGMFMLACICVPLFTFGVIYTVQEHQKELNHIMQLCWGASLSFLQIPILPFILRNSEKSNHTAAISLSYASFSISTIAGMLVVGSFQLLDPVFFSERNLLYGFAFAGFLAIFLINKIKIVENIPVREIKKEHNDYDWGVITKALIPTLIIAIGAGFTIPFISLFFVTVHHQSTAEFSFLNLIAALLIASGSLFVPLIKSRIGYRVAVPTTQGFAVIALVLMATTQFYADLSIAVYIAAGCFLLRQPLMNLAGPMTTEIVMNYVGRRNREIVSGLSAAIWSGSWYFSGELFSALRNNDVDYVYIFMITAALYTVGVIWYSFLIRDYDERNLRKVNERSPG
jgi:predicted MFS family arabinose efflux permease